MSKSDDLISRQAAIQWVKANCNPYGKPTLDYESGIRVMEHLKRMSSAQPEILACGEGELNVPGTNVGDMISRQAAIDEAKRLHDVAWANWKETRISANTMIDALKDLPSAQPEQRWIPVTERMPEEGHNILISTAYGYVGEGEYKGYKEYHHTWVQYRWSVILRDDEVTAWMPLPEPYREEKQDA